MPKARMPTFLKSIWAMTLESEGLPIPSKDFALEFAITYDEPVCDGCKSRMVTHSFREQSWRFWCPLCLTSVHRLTVMLLDRRGGSGKWIRNEIGDDECRSQDRDSGECDDSGTGLD